MKKRPFYNIFIRILCLFMLIAIVGTIPVYGNSPYSFVSIGDAMSGGISLTAPSESLYTELCAAHYGASLKSYYVSGMTASSLILALSSGAYSEALRGADVIMLNFGMTDLCSEVSRIAENALSTYSLTFAGLLEAYSAGDDISAYSSALSALRNALTDSGELKKLAENFTKSVTTAVSLVHEIAPGRVIYICELYNPYKSIGSITAGSEKLAVSSLISGYITDMNAAFEGFGSYVVPVALNGVLPSSQLQSYKNGWDGSLASPQLPNEAGHASIASALISAMAMPEVTDISGHWGEAYIRRVLSWRVYNAILDKNFEPDRAMKRAQFVTVLGKTMSAKVEKYNLSPFRDVDMNTYYGKYVTWAQYSNIVQGGGSYRFYPQSNITREEMAVMLDRLSTEYAVSLSSSEEIPVFTDSGDISDWARDAVTRMARAGILRGDENGEFHPHASITNAEIATILCRLDDCAELFGYLG